MGQFHSAGINSPAGEQIGDKADYYDLLGVQHDASTEEIKKSYRKKALELHPDRNYGNVESATRLFAEIQSAYEVLSDPQERAWYDSHRSAFLGGGVQSGDGDYSYNIRLTTTEDIYALFSQFSPRMEFSDATSGFYGGLRETFDRLATEEKAACQWEGLELVGYPSFGRANDDFDAVVRPFYATWNGFATRKTFAWKDIHRYSDAPDRRVRRIMERENQRLRDEGIREFNEAVRSLVSFAKKRDPRYKASIKSEAQRQEALRQASAAQAARSRAANNAKLRDMITPDWARSEEVDEEDNYESASEPESEYFECVACRKTFKNPRQLEAHERSKKHLKAVRQLRWEMKAQSKHFGLDADEYSEASQDTNGQQSIQNDEEHEVDTAAANETGLLAMGDLKEVLDGLHAATPKSMDEDLEAVPDSEPLGDHFRDTVSGSGISDGDYATRESIVHRLRTDSLPEPAKASLSTDASPQRLPDHDLDGDAPAVAAPRKVGKAKQKRDKRAAKTAAQQFSELSCVVCGAAFPSRSQLFRHIRELDHAQMPSQIKNKRKKP